MEGAACPRGPVERGLCQLDEQQVDDDHAEQQQEEGRRQRREAEQFARPVCGRMAPTTAAPVGTSSMGRLGLLLKNGTRRVRIT